MTQSTPKIDGLLEPQNLTLLYQQLEQRIDLYLKESLERYPKKDARPLSKTILRQLRIQQMENLRNYIYLHEQWLQGNFNSHPNEIAQIEEEFGSDFVALYNELLRMQRNIQKLNTHKSANQKQTGRFADCVYDLLELLEVQVLLHENEKEQLHNFITEKFFYLMKPLQKN